MSSGVSCWAGGIPELTRFRSLLLVLGGVLAAIVLAFTSGRAAPPNVILVLADDMAPGDIAAFNGGRSRTPNIDRLVRDGLIRPTMKLRVFPLLAAALFTAVCFAQSGAPPGVVVASSPEPDRACIGTPSIVIVPDGSCVAAHDFSGRTRR
jgi:hypothetical protein